MTLPLQFPTVPLGKNDVTFAVRQSGGILGTLKVSKGALVWRPGKGKQATRFTEAKAWTTGYHLWSKAKAAGVIMPVVFADETDCSRLLYWGILTNPVIEGKTTRYSVKQMRKIKGRHLRQTSRQRTRRT